MPIYDGWVEIIDVAWLEKQQQLLYLLFVALAPPFIVYNN